MDLSRLLKGTICASIKVVGGTLNFGRITTWEYTQHLGNLYKPSHRNSDYFRRKPIAHNAGLFRTMLAWDSVLKRHLNAEGTYS